MLQATVLGSGLSPGHVLHARASTRARDDPFPTLHSAPVHLLAQPRYLLPSSAAGPSSSNTSSSSSSRVPLSTSKLHSSALDGDEALTWCASEVTWSRGAEVVRRFTYEHERTGVDCAAFAWFDDVELTGKTGGRPSSPVSPAGSSSSGSTPALNGPPQLPSASSSDPTFGPFHTSQNASWSPQPCPRERQHGMSRAIVVFLRGSARIYFATGEEFVVHLPFVVDGCWALPTGGLLIQRALEAREKLSSRRNRQSSMFDRTAMSVLDDLDEEPDMPLPRLYTITDRYGDLNAVVQAPVRRLGDVPRLAPNAPTSSIPPSQTVLYVAPDPYPFVVVYDRQDGQIIFYRRNIVPLESEDTPAPPPPVTSLRPDELLRQADVSLAASTRRSGRASLNRTTAAERRISIVGPDPLDRTRRRTSRLSAANDEEFGLPAFVLPNTTVEGARLSRGSGGPEGGAKGRRVSGTSMREDPFEFGKTALAVVAEDLRETTMMMGLDREEVRRSEIVLERIWTWRPPGPIDPSSAHIFLSENRSPEFILLNLVLNVDGYSTTLYTFHVAKSNWRYVFHELREVPCLAAQPIIATRSDVLDTLVLTVEGARLLSASGHETPIDIPRVPTIDGRDEVARQLASSLSMVLDGDGATLSRRSVVDLVDPSGSRVTVVYNDGERVRVSFDFTLQPGLPRRALEALSYALSPEEYAELSETYLQELQARPAPERLDLGCQWETFAEVLCTKCGLAPATPTDSRSKMLSAWTTQSDPILRLLAQRVQASSSRAPEPSSVITPATCTPSALLALHFVAQDCRLSCTSEPELSLIAPVIARLAAAVGRMDWVDYWRRLMPSALAGVVLTQPAVTVDTSVLDAYNEPADVLLYLGRRLVWPTKPFPCPQTAFGQPSPLGSPSPCSQTELLSAIYARMTPPTDKRSPSSTEKRALAVVSFIVDSGLDASWLADLPPSVGVPILEMIRVCQLKPPKDGSEAIFTFIGREDLAAMYTERVTVDLPMGAEDGPDDPPTVAQLMNADASNKHSHFAALPHVRFGLDKRLDEVDRIMQTTRQRTITVDAPKGSSEGDVQNYHQSVVNTIAHRTLAVTVGQGMFMYGSRTAPITDAWQIPLIELAVKVIPGNNVLKAQLPDGAEWPCFHNGVSAALSISPECTGITASWISFNRPNPLSAEHGGFLLGLGLMGHLRLINSTQAFSYLEPRHDITSVGLLLGIGSSFAGSRDQMVTKLLSLHTHALLPMGAMELSQSAIVQSAALVALGLVYVGSKNLRMAEMALGEISRSDMHGVEGFYDHREAYSFSSAMAFGLIMLGRGGQETSEVERKMLAQLNLLIHGDAPDVLGMPGKRRTSNIDPTITSPGATLALGLMYLKSGRKDIADMLEIPQTELELESVRPDQLLVRTFARALIMWNDVKGTTEWVDAQLPPFIRELHNDHKRNGMELNTELAYLNIIAGACLGLGIRYASAANEAVHHVIIKFFSVVGKAVGGQSMTYEAKIRRNAARQALNVVTIAAAVQMSGTGELNVTRRLRVSHGQEGASVNYGSHMAMHMALGLLFLGRGYFTLGNSNLAIAAMSIAFFPRFLSSPGDNRAYPQAFRHLWALAVEPRCLIARDVDTRKSIFLPIKVKVRGKPGDNSLISPTLVAPFESVECITVDSPRYWPVVYNLNNPRDRNSLVRTRTIWVKRKTGFLDYSADPRGYRSMFVRAGTMSGFDMHYDLISPAAPLALPPAEGIDLISSHTDDPVFVALAERFSGDTWFESFVRCVLFECLSLDKPNMLSMYLGLGLGLQARDDLSLERVAQAAFLNKFYRPGVYDKLYLSSTTSSDKRHPIVRQTFIQAITRRLAALGTGAGSGSGSGFLGMGSTDAPPSRAEYFAGLPLALHPTEAAALAAYLARNNVPPLRLLEALRDRVSLVADDPVQMGLLEVKARAAAERYWSAVMDQYDEVEEGPTESGLWKLDSLHEALEVWTSGGVA